MTNFYGWMECYGFDWTRGEYSQKGTQCNKTQGRKGQGDKGEVEGDCGWEDDSTTVPWGWRMRQVWLDKNSRQFNLSYGVGTIETVSQNIGEGQFQGHLVGNVVLCHVVCWFIHQQDMHFVTCQ